MAYLIKLSSRTSYWSGDPFSVWVSEAEKAKEYSTKKEAEKELKEIAEQWGYTLEAIKSDDAPSISTAVVEEESSEISVAPELSAEDIRKLAS